MLYNLELLIISVCFISVSCTHPKSSGTIPQNIVNLHGNWANQALESLLVGVGRKTLNRLPRWYQPIFRSCFNAAGNDVTSQAYCLARAFDRQHKTVKSLVGGSKFNYRFTQPVRRVKRRADRLIDPLLPYETYLGNDIKNTMKQQFESARSKQSTFEVEEPSFQAQLFSAAARLFGFSTTNRNPAQSQQSWQRLQRLMKLSSAQQKGQFNPRFPEKNDGFLRLMHDFAEVTHAEQKSSLSLFSPKFLSLSYDDPKAAKLFSPRFLSLQKEEAFSLDHVVGEIDPANKQEWMNILMEVTGANTAAEQVLSWIDADGDNTTYSERHTLAKKHLRLIEHWATYMDSFNKRQINDMDNFGYTLLDRPQLELMFRRRGPFDRIHIDSFAYRYSDHATKELALEDEIRSMALGSWNHRQQQSVLTPAIFAPATLSPSVLGAATLSPSLFSPAILSPGALSPVTLSPFMFNPAILSPVVLSPVTLSPFMFSPVILSPTTLSPNILSPFMFSPVILSPSALDPAILSPSMLDGVLLSPAALSPGILSPTLLTFDVLSPTVLS